MLRSAVEHQIKRHVSVGAGANGLETGNRMHGSYHWMYERFLAGASLATISYGVLAGPSNALDIALSIVLPLHCHIGFQTIIDDYLPKRKFGAVLTMAKGSLLAATALSLYGAYKFNTENVGISEAISQLWKSKIFYQEVKSHEYEE